MKNLSVANELVVSYVKNPNLNIEDFKVVNNSRLMNVVFKQIWNQNDLTIRESFYAIFFNPKLDVVGYRKIGDGSLDAVMVDMRIIFSSALLANATHIAVAHNHPSGSLKPSSADLNLTQQIVSASKVLNISFLDHLIITEDDYYSFRDEGNI